MNTDKIYAEQLANEYAPKDTSKVVALRKLDAKAKQPASIFTYTLGVLSALVFGLLGIFGMSVNYPVYRKLLAKGKKKHAFEILELAKEISGQ